MHNSDSNLMGKRSCIFIRVNCHCFIQAFHLSVTLVENRYLMTWLHWLISLSSWICEILVFNRPDQKPSCLCACGFIT